MGARPRSPARLVLARPRQRTAKRASTSLKSERRTPIRLVRRSDTVRALLEIFLYPRTYMLLFFPTYLSTIAMPPGDLL